MPKLVRFALRLAIAMIQLAKRSPKALKFIEWPQTKLEYLTVKSIPFRSTNSRFRDTTCTRSGKIGKHRMTQNWTWTLNSKNTLYTKYMLNTYVRGPNIGPFSSASSRFLDTRLSKSEMHRITPNWTWTRNSQKYPTCTKYLPLRSKFWSVLLSEQRFPG